MMKYLMVFLLMGNLSLAADGEKHRGELVKVLSATSIQVKESKTPVTLTLRGVSDKKLTKAQKAKAINYLKSQLSGQVLIWETFKEGSELSPNGVGQISRNLLELGLVNLDPKSPSTYKQFMELGQSRKVGIWEQK